MLRDAGMHVPALVRGGFFPATDGVGTADGDRRQPRLHRRGPGDRGGDDRAGRRGGAGHAAGGGAQAGRRRHRRDPARGAGGRGEAGHRAAAPDVCRRPKLHQPHGRGPQDLRAAPPPAGRHRLRRLPRLVGPGPAVRDRLAGRAGHPLRLPRLRLARRNPPPAQRPRPDGRRLHRPPHHPRLGRRSRLPTASTKSKSSPRNTGRWTRSRTFARSATPTCVTRELTRAAADPLSPADPLTPSSLRRTTAPRSPPWPGRRSTPSPSSRRGWRGGTSSTCRW